MEDMRKLICLVRTEASNVKSIYKDALFIPNLIFSLPLKVSFFAVTDTFISRSKNYGIFNFKSSSLIFANSSAVRI